jgi:hypothetical protein
MTEWRPAVEFFDSPRTPAAPGNPPAVFPSLPARGFVKDPARLTRSLVGWLWAYLGVGALSALVALVFLATGQVGQATTDELTLRDLAGLLLGLPQMVIVIVTGVLFLMWIHRANRNARGLGAQGLTFTPGWSVGWYFIPIVNLWKPYQAMKQIWQASADPGAWRSQTPPSLLPLWWTLWIVSNVLSQASFRLSLQADTGAALVASEVVTVISDLVDIPLCLVAMRLVREVLRLQTHWATQPMESVCALCRQPAPPSELVLLNQTWVCARCKPVLVQQMREGLTSG